MHSRVRLLNGYLIVLLSDKALYLVLNVNVFCNDLLSSGSKWPHLPMFGLDRT